MLISFCPLLSKEFYTIIEEDYAKGNDTDRMSTGLAHLVPFAMMG